MKHKEKQLSPQKEDITINETIDRSPSYFSYFGSRFFGNDEGGVGGDVDIYERSISFNIRHFNSVD